MPTILRAAFVLFPTLVLAAGCGYEQPEPLSPFTEAIADPSIVGRWTCKAPGEPETTVTIAEARPREYAIELSAPRQNTARLRGFVTRNGSNTVVNVQQIGASDIVSKDRYAAVRYVRQADGSLDVATLKSRENGVDVYDELFRCVR